MLEEETNGTLNFNTVQLKHKIEIKCPFPQCAKKSSNSIKEERAARKRQRVCGETLVHFIGVARRRQERLVGDLVGCRVLVIVAALAVLTPAVEVLLVQTDALRHITHRRVLTFITTFISFTRLALHKREQ